MEEREWGVEIMVVELEEGVVVLGGVERRVEEVAGAGGAAWVGWPVESPGVSPSGGPPVWEWRPAGGVRRGKTWEC